MNRAAATLDIASQPRFAAEGLSLIPHRRLLAVEVQQQHAPVVDRVEEGPESRLGPEGPLVHERPALQNPDRLWVALGHAGVDRPRKVGQILRVAAGRDHLDERVGRVEMVRAVPLRLLFEKNLGDFREMVFRSR